MKSRDDKFLSYRFRRQSLIVLFGMAMSAGWFVMAALHEMPPPVNVSVYDDIERVSRQSATGTRAELVPTLMRAFPSLTNTNLREMVTVVLGLNALVDQREAEANSFRNYLKANFPGSRYQPLLEPTTNPTPCRVCNGAGKLMVNCPACKGSGKCVRCNGRGTMPTFGSAGGTTLGFSTGSRSGFVSSGRNVKPLGGPSSGDGASDKCIVCKGSGVCRDCNGEKMFESMCAACKGKGQIFIRNVRPVFSIMLLRLADEAFVAGQEARERRLFDGKWLEKDEYVNAERRRNGQISELRLTFDDAVAAGSANAAYGVMDNASAKFDDTPLSWHFKELRTQFNRDREAERNWDEVVKECKNIDSGAIEMIKQNVQTLLNSRLRHSEPVEAVSAPGVADNLPAGLISWKIGKPLLIGRTAQVLVTMDCVMAESVPTSTTMRFYLSYTANDWRVMLLEIAWF